MNHEGMISKGYTAVFSIWLAWGIAWSHTASRAIQKVIIPQETQPTCRSKWCQ